MFAFLSVYVKLYGWALAGGVILSIYVHEMGHVAAMVRYGMQASAPMFVPGFGAFVRSSHAAATPREDAVIGLAGPIWGLGAALVCYGVYLATGAAIWAAIAHVGAMLNLLNLTPVWQLDGARAFSAMSRQQRWGVTAVLALGALFSGQKKLWLLVLLGAYNVYQGKTAPDGDRRTVVTFLALAAALTWLMSAAAVAGTPM
jgi:Zn-dependent protease